MICVIIFYQFYLAVWYVYWVSVCVATTVYQSVRMCESPDINVCLCY